jgi:SNF2 family DNA or RNA helicase
VNRGEIVRRFNDESRCRVFLGSLKAGGAGIDLVAGTVVIHYDRWWNAAREDQATDRVHRIGQKRAVQVFKLVAAGTLEEKISAIIDGKRRLMDAVVQADNPHLDKIFTREELIDLLRPV